MQIALTNRKGEERRCFSLIAKCTFCCVLFNRERPHQIQQGLSQGQLMNQPRGNKPGE